MENSRLIQTFEMDCPFCGFMHNVEKRQRTGQMLIKNEPVSFEEIYFVCPLRKKEEENEFVPAAVMDENLRNARDAYRCAHGLLTSREIVSIRAVYGVSQSDLALLLGWGEVTVTRYESKSIQDDTYDQILRMVQNDPMFVLEQLKRRRGNFNSAKYDHIKASVLKQIEKVGLCHLNQKAIEVQYADYGEPNDLNGYQKLSLTRLESVMAFFAHDDRNLFKVKLMKLLWYVDALAFQMYGKTVTGLVYMHKPYGALPLANAEIIHLPSLSVEEIEINDHVGYHITAEKGWELAPLSAGEKEVVYRVAGRFRNVTAQQIVDYMHHEDAYANTDMNQVIPFSLCRTLKKF